MLDDLLVVSLTAIEDRGVEHQVRRTAICCAMLILGGAGGGG